MSEGFMTFEDAEALVIMFGHKHKNKTCKQVMLTDPSYASWIETQAGGTIQFKKAQEALAILSGTSPSPSSSSSLTPSQSYLHPGYGRVLGECDCLWVSRLVTEGLLWDDVLLPMSEVVGCQWGNVFSAGSYDKKPEFLSAVERWVDHQSDSLVCLRKDEEGMTLIDVATYSDLEMWDWIW